MKRLTFITILVACLCGCAADLYHPDPLNLPSKTVQLTNKECAYDSIRIGEVNPTGFIALGGGILGGAAGGAAAGAIGSATSPHLARWDACMARNGWLRN